jgi:hypothetical protein
VRPAADTVAGFQHGDGKTGILDRIRSPDDGNID